MQTVCVCLISIVFALRGAAAPTAPNLLSKNEVAGWQNDLKFLETEIVRVHPNPFHSVSRETLRSAFEDLEKRLPKMDRDAAIVGLARIVALLQRRHIRRSASGGTLAIGFGQFPEPLFLQGWAVREGCARGSFGSAGGPGGANRLPERRGGRLRRHSNRSARQRHDDPRRSAEPAALFRRPSHSGSVLRPQRERLRD